MGFIKLFNPMLGWVIVTKNRDLLWQLTRRSIISRYQGSILGLLWSLVQPLLLLAVYTFVFSVVFKMRWGIDNGDNKTAFAIIMFCGMTIFNIFSECVNGSCGLITGNPNYVKKVIFPLEVLPFAHVLAITILSIIWFFLLFLGAFFFLDKVSSTMLFLPVTVIPLILICAGVSLFVASLTVYLRDISQLVSVITQILFYMTPIFYPIQAVPERYQWILQINPLTLVIEQTRLLFLYGKMPNWYFCLISWIIAFIVFQLGLVWFEKTKKGFADVL